MHLQHTTKPEYPKRERFFANRFVRLLFKTCAAQEIGLDGVALLTCIAMTEDAARYRRPVTYFNEQLCSILAIGNWRRLDRIRRECVQFGWLHYEAPPKGTRRAGHYFVTIPPDCHGLDDGVIDEGAPVPYAESGDTPGDCQGKAYAAPAGTPGEALTYTPGEAPGELSTLTLSPDPTPKKERRAGAARRTFPVEFGTAWNSNPRKLDKGNAAKAFATAVQAIESDGQPRDGLAADAGRPQIATWLANRWCEFVRTSWPRQRLKKIQLDAGDAHPMPRMTTWLSGGRYDDEFEQWRPPQGGSRGNNRRQPAHAGPGQSYDPEDRGGGDI